MNHSFISALKSYMIFILRLYVSTCISLASFDKWDECFHLFQWRHFGNFTWLHALLHWENRKKYTEVSSTRVPLGWYFILSSILDYAQVPPISEVHGIQKSSNKTTRKRKSEKVGMKEVGSSYLTATFKRATENLLCLQYLSGFCVRCDQFTNASCKPPVLLK